MASLGSGLSFIVRSSRQTRVRRLDAKSQTYAAELATTTIARSYASAKDVGCKHGREAPEELGHGRFELKNSAATGKWAGISKRRACGRMEDMNLSGWRPSRLGHEFEVYPQLSDLRK